MKALLILGALTAAAALLVAASGTSTAPATASTPTANIVQTAVKAGQFRTLVALVKRAGLASALSGKGQLTVFAPTDGAFAKVPRQTLAALKSNPAKLRAVLLYHVAKGRLTAAKVARLRSVKTVNGAALRIRVSGGKVFVNSARVVKANVPASNGVIHVVNRVLIPPAA
ncbi:MAG TPA: fasciclin domain-containing protein [Gaiellaceae bacterium]|nr:fasciclin domain-containing protein [Gaiellaceae bacterium]